MLVREGGGGGRETLLSKGCSGMMEKTYIIKETKI